MCGLFGVAVDRKSGLLKKHTDFIEQAMYVDALRGWDSTGLAILDESMGSKVHKRALPAADFMMSRVGLRAMKDANSTKTRVVIGHNRAATVGDVRDEYSHPFKYDHITGAHNGTLRSRRGLVNTNSPVDSMDLIHAFSRTEPEDYTRLLREVDGAYALTIANSKDGLLYFVRNTARPLNIMWDDSDMYWGSEAGMLWWLLERNKVNIDKVEHLEVEPHRLYSYDIKSGDLVYTDYKPKPVATTSTVGGASKISSGNSRTYGVGPSFNGEERVTAEELLKAKILHKSDMEGNAFAVNISWRPYNQSGNTLKSSWGELTGEWYYDASQSVRFSADGVPKEIADAIIEEDGGVVMFTPFGGYRSTKDKSLIRVCARLKDLNRCVPEDDGDTDGESAEVAQTGNKKSNVTSIDSHRLARGDVSDFTQQELDVALDKGCTGCKRTLGLGDLETVGIYNRKVFCGDCSESYESSLEEGKEEKSAVH